MTMAERILAHQAGRDRVEPGEIVEVPVGLAYTWEGILPLFMDDLERFGGRIWDPDRVLINIDHYPAPTIAHAESTRAVAEFARRHGITKFFPHHGVPNMVVAEQGLARPGGVVVGTDSHACTLGAFGTFACGLGHTEMLGVFLTGKIWFKVPETVRFIFTGRLPAGLMAKDLVLEMARRIGAGWGNYKAFEFTGEAMAAMDMDGRMVFANLATDLAAKVGLIAPDARTRAYLEERRPGYDPGPQELWDLCPDPGAKVAQEIVIDAGRLQPLVALPGQPDNGRPIPDLGDVPVDQAFIGTCNGGRLEDLRAAAAVLRGRSVHPRVRLLIVPASQAVFKQGLDEGLIHVFLEAGAVVQAANCGPCLGMHQGVLAAGEVCISAGNRNYPGRMGARAAQIFLGSAATVAASAVAGKIVDPRTYSQ